MRVNLFSLHHLIGAKVAAANGDHTLQPALHRLRQDADAALELPPVSVMDKPRAPASGDKHDYFSVGPYWWPNPNKSDGLPYVRRDGEVNPDRDLYDNVPLGRMTAAVEALALAGYVFDDQRSAQHAARLLRTWFLDPDTRMNPHLEYAQAIPGICDGRDIGIIDTAGKFPRLVDAIGVLESTGGLSDDDMAGLTTWFTTFRDWLRDSAHGRGEKSQPNNHGTYYDLQLAALSLFTHQSMQVMELCFKAADDRIAAQIEPDGAQPHELARTNARSYAVMNAFGLACLAQIAQGVNVDLWSFETRDGRSLSKAIDWLAAVALDERPWTWRQISPWDDAQQIPLFTLAANRLKHARIHRALDALAPQVRASHRVNITGA